MNEEIIRDYNTTASIYDDRYREEQSLKISFVMSKIRPHNGNTVIDIGCGTGMLLERLKDDGLHVGLDASSGMLREAKRKGVCAELVLGDAQSLPFRERCFDIAYSISVLQLLDDPETTASEIIRVLRGGGAFAVSILLKLGPEKIKKITGFFGSRSSSLEVYESESMKDIFLLGENNP